MMNKPKAYIGKDKYIFVSYSHKDNEIVFPIISALQEKYNVWFDEGIHFGTEWEDEIADRLLNCELFIFIVSQNSINSDNCKDEIHLAREENKNFINVILEDFKLPSFFTLRYSRYQSCKYYHYKNEKDAIDDMERKCDWFDACKKVTEEEQMAIEETNNNQSVPIANNQSVKKIKDIVIKGTCHRLFIELHKKSDITFVDNNTSKQLDLKRSTDSSGKEVIDVTTKRSSVTLYLPTHEYNYIEIDVNIDIVFITNNYYGSSHLRCKCMKINSGIKKQLNLHIFSNGALNIDHVQSNVTVRGEFNKLSVNCNGDLFASIQKIGDELSLVSNNGGVSFSDYTSYYSDGLKFHLTFKEKFIDKKVNRPVKKKSGGYTNLIMSAAKFVRHN